MNRRGFFKRAALSAAATAAAGAAIGVGGGFFGGESPKSTALTSPEDKYKQQLDDKHKQRLKSLRARRLDREPELTPAQRTQRTQRTPERTPERTQRTPQRTQRTPDKVTSNFSWSEFMSKDGSPLPNKYKSNILELAKNLEVLRDAAGGRPISLTSGYRSPEHNANVGGKKNSQHLLGKAADMRISGLSPQKVAFLIEKLIKDGKMKEGGIGIYPNKGFVHYDVRGTTARWPKKEWK